MPELLSALRGLPLEGVAGGGFSLHIILGFTLSLGEEGKGEGQPEKLASFATRLRKQEILAARGYLLARTGDSEVG